MCILYVAPRPPSGSALWSLFGLAEYTNLPAGGPTHRSPITQSCVHCAGPVWGTSPDLMIITPSAAATWLAARTLSPAHLRRSSLLARALPPSTSVYRSRLAHRLTPRTHGMIHMEKARRRHAEGMKKPGKWEPSSACCVHPPIRLSSAGAATFCPPLYRGASPGALPRRATLRPPQSPAGPAQAPP